MKYKILVVDDELGVVEDTARWLYEIAARYRDQIEVFTTVNVSDGKDILANQSIDVVITDYEFPSGMSGDALIDAVVDPFRTKLVVLMSKHESDKVENVVRKRHQNLGERFRFLKKPFKRLELESKYLEIEQFFTNLPYPSPLEYTRQRLSNPLKGGLRISVIKDLIETFLKFSTAIMMSDLAERNPTFAVELKIRLSADLTFGAWVNWFSTALDAINANGSPSFMPELQQLFVGDRSDISKLIYEFKNYRNSKEHGFTAPEEKYDLDVEKYLPIVDAFVKALSFVARYPVFVPVNLDFAPNDPGSFIYDSKVLMGTGAVLAQTQLVSPEHLKVDRVYCYSPGQHCLSLYPFLHFKLCGSCGVLGFYMLDRITPSECSFNSTCNHRFSDKQSRTEFSRKIEPLFIKSEGAN